MGNEDRIQNWRRARKMRDGGTEAGEDTLTLNAEDEAPIPSRRDEELEFDRRLREDIVESKLPTEEEIAAEVEADRERRRERAATLRRRVLLLIGLPLLLVALYKVVFSPPLYAARTSFAIMTAAPQGAAMPAAGLFAGAGGGPGLTDAYRIREYLLSREAMREMERRHGFLAHFSRATIDPFQRPVDLPLLGIDAHDFYQKRLAISVDLREGIVRLKVDAVTPEMAERFANGLLALARERTQNISEQLNADQFQALQRDVAMAQEEMRKASTVAAGIQRRRAELDPQQSAAGIYQLIGNLEVLLAEAEAERTGLTANGLSESPLLPRLNARIAELKRQIAEQRGRLVGDAGGRTVQNAAAELELATAQRRLAETSLESTMRTFEQAKLRSIEERRYLVVISAPVLPEPVKAQRIFNNLLLALAALLLLIGIISILRNARFLRSVR